MSQSRYILKQDVKYNQTIDGYYLLTKGCIVNELNRHGDLVQVRCGRGLYYELNDDMPKAQFGFYTDDIVLSADVLEKIEDEQ